MSNTEIINGSLMVYEYENLIKGSDASPAKIGASELHSFGLIHSIVQPSTALHHALVLSEQLNSRACNVNASIKELINASYTQGLTEQMQQEREHLVRNLYHPNAGIGIESFLNKHAPQFKK